MQQSQQTFRLRALLTLHFAHRDDVLISGEGYLRSTGGNGSERLAPDCVVAFGVDLSAIVARNGYVIGEVGKPPEFVLEVAFRGTGSRDYLQKREGYAAFGVPEYWRFDHTGGRYHDSALAGDELVDDEYRPAEIVHEPDGLIWGYSAVLGCRRSAVTRPGKRGVSADAGGAPGGTLGGRESRCHRGQQGGQRGKCPLGGGGGGAQAQGADRGAWQYGIVAATAP